jgi:hypothetical protein
VVRRGISFVGAAIQKSNPYLCDESAIGQEKPNQYEEYTGAESTHHTKDFIAELKERKGRASCTRINGRTVNAHRVINLPLHGSGSGCWCRGRRASRRLFDDPPSPLPFRPTSIGLQGRATSPYSPALARHITFSVFFPPKR